MRNFVMILAMILLLSGCAPHMEETEAAPPNRSLTESAHPESDAAPDSVTETETAVGDSLTEIAILGTAEQTVAEETELSDRMETNVQLLAGVKIGIDPGHQRYGNSEQEAVAPGSSQTKNKVTGGAVGASTQIPEYVTVLEISEFLRDQLEALGAVVYMTRESHDVDISNQERTRMMNDYGVDLMLRIHCDSSEDQSANGCALYVSQSNSIAEQSRLYAEKILPAICEATGEKNNGIVQNDQYTGQNWAQVPCIMIECGFVSNPEEDQLLNSPDYQELVAKGICDGLIACFSADASSAVSDGGLQDP